MSKLVKFENRTNKEGEKMFKRAEYFTIGEINGTEVRVPFEGVIYTLCEECGQPIEMDIHELVRLENEDEDFTDFGAFTCHDCLQKEKQDTGLGKMKLGVLDIMTKVTDELESLTAKNKDALRCILGEAFEADNENGIALWLEQTRGYADALNTNGLMDDAEYDILTVEIDGIMGAY
ncbi:MAG: hypothetical protein PHY44_00815 [Lachnospiraceae bacterium]|nr:hypothetical protein [Lachnospiraceae bacterium]